MKCNTFFISSICYHFFKLFFTFQISFKSLLQRFSFSRTVNVHFLNFHVVLQYHIARYSLFQIVTSQPSLFVKCKTLKKEGPAFRNIGKNVYIYIPDCKIFVLCFHLQRIRSFIRILSFFVVSWSLLQKLNLQPLKTVYSKISFLNRMYPRLPYSANIVWRRRECT